MKPLVCFPVSLSCELCARDGVEHMWAFPSRYPLELNSYPLELKCLPCLCVLQGLAHSCFTETSRHREQAFLSGLGCQGEAEFLAFHRGFIQALCLPCGSGVIKLVFLWLRG